ncbi:hypothetical protein [Chryseobacterium lactis]|uniref:hypothetical protein n=1 Tax=Chryseobacterium lactis TaxID=1241981 RepID=UPI00162A8276|nr:hypothetical protein [Chryseobacterium lactis]
MTNQIQPEKKLWGTAGKLCVNKVASKHKHVVLKPVFYKNYIPILSEDFICN